VNCTPKLRDVPKEATPKNGVGLLLFRAGNNEKPALLETIDDVLNDLRLSLVIRVLFKNMVAVIWRLSFPVRATARRWNLVATYGNEIVAGV